jgi:acyl dehydratase
MLTVDHAMDLKAYEGQELGASGWVTVTQEGIDDFARLTGDDHWIHVDVARASTEMPGGQTIAHGLFILSFIPALQRQIYSVRARGRGLSYGFDRIRFVAPIPAGSRFRLRQVLIAATRHERGTRLEIDSSIEIEGATRPATVARNILLIEDK